MDYDIKLKTTFIGQSAVGKTSLVTRLLHDRFDNTIASTVGAAFFTYTNNRIRYEIWDTAGSERYMSLAPMYYRSSHIVVLVYDLTDDSTLERLESYFFSIDKYAGQNYEILVVANKCDLVSEDELNHAKTTHPQIISRMSLLPINGFVFASAKTGMGIFELQQLMIDAGCNMRHRKIDNTSDIVVITSDKAKTCCAS